MGASELISALMGGLVTLVPTIAAAWVMMRKSKTQQKKELRQDTISEMQFLIAQIKENAREESTRQDNKIKEQDEKIDKILEELQGCMSEHAESRGHILYLEQMLSKRGYSFRPWSEVKQTNGNKDKDENGEEND